MHNDALDAFTRQAARLLSRRTTLQALGGSTLALLTGWTAAQESDARRRKKRRKKKKRCKAECCKDADCGPLKLCAQGQCVIGQGTCPSDAPDCDSGGVVCGSIDLDCACFVTTVGTVRCGANKVLPNDECGGCVNDLDCAADHPDIPGVFCVQGGTSCGCSPFSFCQAPCPD